MNMNDNTFKSWFFSLPEPHQDDLERNKLLAEWVVKAFNAGIKSATPAESLQAHDDEVIEKCAKVCERIKRFDAAYEIRALKK